jgi:hypothetical protein
LIRFPRAKIGGLLAQCPPLFGIIRFDSCRDCKRDLVLHSEDVRQVTIVAVGPDMVAGFRINELGVDANPLTAAFQHVTHAEFAPDPLHVALPL